MMTTQEIQELGLELKRVHIISNKSQEDEKLEGELEMLLARKMAKLPVVQDVMRHSPEIIKRINPFDIEHHPVLL